MVDLHIVAGGIAPACDGNDARTGGVHGVAGAGIQVNALMVGRSARRGRFTIAEGTGDGGVAAGNQPAAASTAAAAAAPGRSAGAATAGAAGLGRGRYGGCLPGFPFPLLRRVELYFHGGDLLQERIFLLLAFLFQRLKIVGLLQQLLQQCLGFFLLRVHFRLRVIQILLGVFQLDLFRFQLVLGFLHLVGGVAQLLQAALVGGGDLLHHVQPVQQVREAVGLEDDFPVGYLALFLHGADAVFVFLIQGFQTVFRRVQLVLLVRNEQVIGGDLFVDVDDLGVQKLNFLIDHILFRDQIRNFVLVFLVLLLHVRDLVLHLLALLLQGNNLLADLAGGRRTGKGGQNAHQKRQQQYRRHDAGEDGYQTFAIFHRNLLFTMGTGIASY